MVSNFKNGGHYDAIIAGASFAGLAVASRIKRGRVLLIDRHGIGMHQASACGTTVKMVRDVGCEESILQTFDTMAVHVKGRETDFYMPQYCTIDYGKFCRTLAEQSDAEFLVADAKGISGSKVVTNKGTFSADIVADCTGWPAVLASSVKKDYVKRDMVSFGLETEIPYKKDDKLRFFIDKDVIKDGVAWLFPCGKTARFGVATYTGYSRIETELRRFVAGYGLKVGKIHGGFFCYCMKEPVVNDMFVVGCAAGQTLPLTGEGIKRSVYFGLSCGETIQSVMDGKLTLKQGLEEYRKTALKGGRGYKRLLTLQNLLLKTPDWGLNLIAEIIGIGPVTRQVWERYSRL